MKIRKPSKLILFVSRQSDEINEDFELIISDIKRRYPEYKCMVFTKRLHKDIKGMIVYFFHMFKVMWYMSVAQGVVLDSYSIPASILSQRKELVIVQMWHAIGSFKKFGFSTIDKGEGSKKELAEAMDMHKNYTYACTSSSYCLKNFAEAFNLSEDKMRILPLPRLDILRDEKIINERQKQVFKEYPELCDGKKIILYAPTFRKEGNKIYDACEKLAQAFEDKNYHLVIKLHPLTPIKKLSQKVILDLKFPTLDFLFLADYVITDYSATVYEAAYLNKPLFFYNFDYETYADKRDFYIDYYKEMPGFISEDAPEIAKAIENGNYDIERVKNFAQKNIAPCKKSYTQDFSDVLIDAIIKSTSNNLQ